MSRFGQAADAASTLMFVAWIMALVSTLAALFIGEVMGQLPCDLCWHQRVFMFPLVAVLGTALLRSDAGDWLYALPLAVPGWLVARLPQPPVLRDHTKGHQALRRRSFLLRGRYDGFGIGPAAAAVTCRVHHHHRAPPHRAPEIITMKGRTLVLSTAFVAVAVFAGGAALYGGRTDDAPPTRSVSNETLVRMHSPATGPAAAPVTIVEFFDPSCEACRAFYPRGKQIMGQTVDDVRLVLRYTPLHEGSDEAVRILEAARKQNLFERVLEALLAQQPAWAVHGEPDLEKAWQFAVAAGLDEERVRQDAVSSSVDSVLEQDVADMKANNVRQTPTFFVNGKPLTEFSPQGLYDLVSSELEATKAGS